MYTYHIMETSDQEEWLEKLQMDYILTKNVWWYYNIINNFISFQAQFAFMPGFLNKKKCFPVVSCGSQTGGLSKVQDDLHLF